MSDEKLSKIEDKIDQVKEHIASIDITLAGQHESLKAHMRRSDLLERHLEMVQAEIKPIERHVTMVNGALKLLGLTSIIVGCIAGVLEIIKYFS